MMMKSNIAKAASPFPPSVFHDWWLAICAASKGRIVMADKPLMKYRIYGGNQSAVLKGIVDKSSYYENAFWRKWNLSTVYGKCLELMIP